jgi:hypothetical protein
LVEEALRVLQVKGKAAFSSTAASPLLAAGSSGGKGSSGEALREWARNSKVLLELLDMTGLEPVKKAMLDLADQVGARMHACGDSIHACVCTHSGCAGCCSGILVLQPAANIHTRACAGTMPSLTAVLALSIYNR